MIGSLFINDKDAFANWSVVLKEGAISNIMLPPNNKPYVTNEQRSSSGVQVFYENTQPQDRDFNVTFVILAQGKEDYISKYTSFINELNKGGIKMRVSYLKTEFNVHVSNYMSLNNYINGKGELNVRFNEPNVKNRVIYD